ncbi:MULTISPECIES: pro-sigmaK processing inhibitor BofA family protein [Desulfitobacterium]|uniref:SigmaK-factor processing regulatory protein BofA n=1 Tax=Desulfitobacterium dehalogenans (strain ATCC 51507 / DSM 9161 / JW/IU-DC1) TaxID=756499 RepID=I4A3K0_DESDJ|nr:MULTISPECIES: pro-sigmaK processing inhibitor BofA family protein [Desulfitobacterium]AFL98534.1 SigmaK-factor processing regulatory protein BofA [Desulfitobacterium dehalogenans ATCC 51507]
MTLIFLALFILLIALVVKSSLGQPNKFLKAGIHILGGIVGLWIFDLVLSVVGFGIPINVFTITLVGLLGFPGVVALVGLQVLGI